MKVWNRIITSLKRNMNHSLVMFSIVFILGNVLFASIAVSQTSNQVDTNMKNRVPSGITIEENDDRIVPGDIHEQLIQVLNKIENEEEVTKITQMNKVLLPQIYIYGDEEFVGRISILNSKDFNVLNSGLQMIAGRKFEESDLEGNQYKIILDQEKMNEYKVGDKYIVQILDYVVGNHDLYDPKYEVIVSKEIEFEIIGFISHFDYVTDEFNYQQYYTHVIPSVWAEEVKQMQNDVLSAHSLEDQEFYRRHIKHFDKLESFMEVKKTFISIKGMEAVDKIEPLIKKDKLYNNASFVLSTSAQDYRYIQAPLENLKALASVTMWASILLVVSLLSLVSALFIRNRKQEIGVLMSLGETKFKLIMQFACEIILVGLLATTFSMVSGNKLGSVISNEFMKIQIDTEAELKYQEDNIGSITQLDMLEAYEVKLDAQYIITIYGVSFIVLLVSTVMPIVFIVKIDPKKVLLS